MCDLETKRIKELAREVGFDLCGVVPRRHLADQEARFRRWLSQGRHATLGYLERHIEKRFDASLLQPGTESVVVCAVNYRSSYSGQLPETGGVGVASYALNRDYHLTIKEMLYELLERLRASYPQLDLQGRAFTDSAPLAEKSLAVEAGLGWIGRHSLLLTPQFGSYVHLGELLLSAPCDSYDAPFEGSRCGDCEACRKACPTAALGEERLVDARSCIACRTIEPSATSADDNHGWIFGCEVCQSVCPHNRHTPLATHPQFQPRFSPDELAPERLARMSDEEFREQFGATPLMRAGKAKLIHNSKFTIHD